MALKRSYATELRAPSQAGLGSAGTGTVAPVVEVVVLIMVVVVAGALSIQEVAESENPAEAGHCGGTARILPNPPKAMDVIAGRSRSPLMCLV